MKRFFQVMALQFFGLTTFSQQEVKVLYETDSKGNYNFYSINENYCDYTLEVYFQDIVNFKYKVQLPYKTVVSHGKNFLFTLEPDSPYRLSTFRYNYYYFKGPVNPKVDYSIKYLLPIAEGMTTEPFKLDYLKISKKDQEPKDYYALGFKVNAGDTIYASRRGVVSSLRDSTNLKYSDYIFTSDENYIEIYHKDCTFARYQVIKKALVEVGDEVEAGDPIAIASGDKYTSGPHVRFWVYYNHEYQNEVIDKDGSKVKKNWAYVPLTFITKECPNCKLEYGNTYTCIKPDSIITQEFTKRQLKKWKKKNYL